MAAGVTPLLQNIHDSILQWYQPFKCWASKGRTLHKRVFDVTKGKKFQPIRFFLSMNLGSGHYRATKLGISSEMKASNIGIAK